MCLNLGLPQNERRVQGVEGAKSVQGAFFHPSSHARTPYRRGLPWGASLWGLSTPDAEFTEDNDGQIVIYTGITAPAEQA